MNEELTCKIGLGDFNNSTNLWFILKFSTLLILFDIFSIDMSNTCYQIYKKNKYRLEYKCIFKKYKIFNLSWEMKCIYINFL